MLLAKWAHACACMLDAIAPSHAASDFFLSATPAHSSSVPCFLTAPISAKCVSHRRLWSRVCSKLHAY